MLGERIYQCRVKKNLSQLDLADALEVSRQSVSKWENNACAPELDKLVKMCELFEVSLDELVRGESGKSPAAFSEQWEACDAVAEPVSESEKETADVKKMWEARKIAGVVLIITACGTMVLSYIFSSRWLVGMAAAGMLLVLGTICMVIKHHTGLACVWGAFLSVYLNMELLEPGILWLDMEHIIRPWLIRIVEATNVDYFVVSRISFILLILLIAITVFIFSRKKKG